MGKFIATINNINNYKPNLSTEGNAYPTQEIDIKSSHSIKKVIIHCGTNDTSTLFQTSNLETVVSTYKKFIGSILEKCCEVEEIIVTSLMPRFDTLEHVERVDEMNRLLEKMVDNYVIVPKEQECKLIFVNIFNEFLHAREHKLSDKGWEYENIFTDGTKKQHKGHFRGLSFEEIKENRLKVEEKFPDLKSNDRMFKIDGLHLTEEGKLYFHEILKSLAYSKKQEKDFNQKTPAVPDLSFVSFVFEFLDENDEILNDIISMKTNKKAASIFVDFISPIFLHSSNIFQKSFSAGLVDTIDDFDYNLLDIKTGELSNRVKSIVKSFTIFNSNELRPSEVIPKIKLYIGMKRLNFDSPKRSPLQPWSKSNSPRINSTNKIINTQLTMPKFSKIFVEPKMIVLDTNLYMESEFKIFENIVTFDYLQKYEINLIIPDLVRNECLEIARNNTNDRRRNNAIKGHELIESLGLHPEILSLKVPDFLGIKEAEEKSPTKTKDSNHDNSNSKKQKKSVDDILLDYCIYLEQTKFDISHKQISRVVFITKDQNLLLKATAKFNQCENPRPYCCENIHQMMDIFKSRGES